MGRKSNDILHIMTISVSRSTKLSYLEWQQWLYGCKVKFICTRKTIQNHWKQFHDWRKIMLHILQRQKKTSNPTRLQRHCIPLILIYIPWTYIPVQQSSQNNNSWLRFFSTSHPDRQQAGVHIGILIFYLLAINPQWNLASFSFVSDSALLFPEITKISSSTSHKWFCSTIGIIVFSTPLSPLLN